MHDDCVFNQWRLAIHHRTRITAILTVLVVLIAGCSVPGLWKYEADGQGGTGSAGGSGAFDAKTYVEGVWADKVLPAISAKAVDAATLLPAVRKDPAAAAKKYGIAANATGGLPTFLIKGSGQITEVDKDSPNGPVTVKVGAQQVQIVTGPVIIGTALRDGAGIKFSDFTNQLDYQAVGTQLNNKVKTEVVGPVADALTVGKTVAFEGVFTLLTPDTITVVPTKLTVS